MQYSLEIIKSLVDDLALKINSPEYILPTYGRSDDGARPHIEVDNQGQLHFVIVERGNELERYTTNDIDDLLYKIFDSVSFSLACKLKRKTPDHEDFRRQLFLKQEELLGILNKQWELHKQEEHREILIFNPFRD